MMAIQRSGRSSKIVTVGVGEGSLAAGTGRMKPARMEQIIRLANRALMIPSRAVQHHDGEHLGSLSRLQTARVGQVGLASPRRGGTRTCSAIQTSIRFAS